MILFLTQLFIYTHIPSIITRKIAYEEKLKWFVHRDFILIAFPLSVAWFDCP